MGLNWQNITGIKTEREFFKLFDEDKDHVIIFRELFPEEAARERAGLVRVPTPDFCKRYHRQKEQKIRPAEWQPKGPEGKMQVLTSIQDGNTEAVRKKKWMQATMRRLKGKGK